MSKQSDSGSAPAAGTVAIPSDLAELACLKAKASGMKLEDYVRMLVTEDAGAFGPKASARKAAGN